MSAGGVIYKVGKRFLPQGAKNVLNEVEKAVLPDDDNVVRLTIDEIFAIGLAATKELCKWRGWKTEIVVPDD